MLYHAVIIKNKTLDAEYAVIRPATDGITELEWEHGCRVFDEPKPTMIEIETAITANTDYELINMDGWNNILESIQDQTNVTNNSFINSNVKPDKWNQRPEIY